MTMSFFGSRSRSLQRTSYSNPPSRSHTPTRSRSSSIEPSYSSYSRPISRATSLQTLQSTGSPFSTLSSTSRFKSASVTGLSTPSSYSPYSYKAPQPSLNRYTSTSSTFRTSLLDIKRPPTIDRYQAPTTDRFSMYRSKYSGANPVIPPSPKYIRQQLPASKYYAGSLPYLSSFANQQGIGAYTKLLQHSFAGANRDRGSNDSLTSMITTRSAGRNNYLQSSTYGKYGGAGGGYNSYSRYGGGGDRYTSSIDRYSTSRTSDRYTSSTADRYGSGGGTSSYYGRSYGGSMDGIRSTYSSGISRQRDSDDASDLYKTRFRPTAPMSKYWTTPRRLLTG